MTWPVIGKLSVALQPRREVLPMRKPATGVESSVAAEQGQYAASA